MTDPLLIIPTYIRTKVHAALLDKCVKSLRHTTDAPVMIVDDGSPHTEQVSILFEYFNKEYKDIETIRKDDNEGFSKTVNIGLSKALAEESNAVLVNADIEFIDDDWLDHIIACDADIVGARLVYPNRTIQHGGIYFSPITRSFDHRFHGAPEDLPDAMEVCECPVTGALQYISHEVMQDIGLYDEEFRLGFEDVDYMIRAIKGGHKSVYDPKVLAMHYESMFRAESHGQHKEWEKESAKYFRDKWKGTDYLGLVPTMMEKTYNE